MKKYVGLDWLRALSCIGIMAMHVAANNEYRINGFIYNRIIPSLTDLVFLFMAISAFGMCCGYYERVLNGTVNWTEFYKKRYMKILPFFMILIILDLAMSFSIPALCEGVMEMTLLHGFIPFGFTVIGVGWFLGTVFIFYLIFPFFCVLIENKKRAWIAFSISFILHMISVQSFHLDRGNFIYSACFFMVGGLIYLYRNRISNIRWLYYVPIVFILAIFYYVIGHNSWTRIAITAALLMLGISIHGSKIKIVSFISSISMEIYLSHMVIFRIVEKLHLNTMMGAGWLQYLLTIILVFTGTILFSFFLQQIINKSFNLLKE